jgi:hypothetical protein
VTINEHDTFDDWPELLQLRELHQNDRMPADVRERVSRRAELLHSALDSPAPPNRSSDASLPWGEPSRAPRARRRHALTLAAGAVLSAAAALALWLGAPPARIVVESEHPAPLTLAARPYTSDELRALGVEPGATEVRVVGTLVPGSLKRLPPLPPHHRTRCGYHFHLRQPGASSDEAIHVEYARCRAPEQLIDDGASCVQVSAIGLLRADGHLDATRITPTSIGDAPCSQPH